MPRKKLLSDERELQVVTRYANGESARAIAADLGCSTQNICNVLARFSITLRPRGGSVRLLSPKQEQKIADALGAGACGRDLAVTYGVSQSLIVNIRKRCGVAPGRVGRRVTKLIDHCAFNAITSANVYWTGFLFADGGIDYSEDTPLICLELARKDRDHVEKFRAFLKSDYAISDVVHKHSYGRDGTTPASSFRARSRPIANALEARGLMVKKSLRDPVAAMAASRDFWRGMVDGDGWIGLRDNYPVVGLSGQRLILDRFQTFLTSHELPPHEIVPTESGIWKIVVSGNNARTLVRLLYRDAGTALERKRERAEIIMQSGGDLPDDGEAGCAT